MKKSIAMIFVLLAGICYMNESSRAQVQPCTASFTFQIIPGSVNGVQFSNTSTSVNSSIAAIWDFGDNTTSTVFNPFHQYANPGSYTVCLSITVSTPNGVVCTARDCDTVVVGASPPPCIDPSLIDLNAACITLYAPVCGCDGVTYPNDCEARVHHGVTSWTQGACPGTGGCNSLSVTIGGGPCMGPLPSLMAVANGGTPPYTYVWNTGSAGDVLCNLQNGTYCVTIKDSYGCTSSTCEVIGASGCQASFTSQSGQLPLDVQFSNTSFSNGSGIASTSQWDFGDGTTSSDLNPYHSFPSAGVYRVCLTITIQVSPTGPVCMSMFCDSIRVGNILPGCQASFSYQVNPNTLTVYFSNSSTGSNTVNFGSSWDFGDNTTSTAIHPQHTFAVAGTYHVCLTIFTATAGGATCTNTYCQDVTVGNNWPGCQANFSFAIDSSGLGVQFTDNSQVMTATFSTQWSFGDGSTSSDFNPFHVYSAPGTYTVCLALAAPVSGLGCRDTICKTIVVGNNTSPCVDPSLINPNCICPAVYAPVCGCDGNTYGNSCEARCHGVTRWTQGACNNANCQASFNFTLDASGSGVQFNNTSNTLGTTFTSLWNFGDGTTSTDQNPHHVFSSPGTYNVCLVVQIQSPLTVVCQDSTCMLVTIGQNTGCNASFVFQAPPNSLTVWFNNTSPGYNTSYFRATWDFGDNTTSTDIHPQHTFPSAGVYNVCLTIVTFTNPGSACTDVYCAQVTVGGTPVPCVDSSRINPNCVCPAVYAPVCGCNGMTYGNDCKARCHGVTSWTQGVCQQSGCQAGFSFTVSANGFTVTFTNTSTPVNISTVVTSTWSFGDGTSSNDRNPQHTYTAPGVYNVCLTITTTNQVGALCTSTFCDSVRVGLSNVCINPALIDPSIACLQIYDPVCGCDGVTYGNKCEALYHHGVTSWTQGICGSSGNCEAKFVWNYGIVPPTIFFTDISTGAIISRQWDFGDGTTSTLPNPSHDYAQSGTYRVCLTVVCGSPNVPFYTSVFCDTIVYTASCINPSLINPQAPCPASYQPVCGCDSITYYNACVAQKRKGVTSWTPGPCHNTCQAYFSFAYLQNGNQVQFFNRSTGGFSRVNWSFGDGASANNVNDPVHLYDVSGWYNVCLTVSNPNGGCQSVYCDSVYATGCTDPSLIDANQPCTAVYQPVCGCDGNTYQNACVATYDYGVTSFTPGACPNYDYCPTMGQDQQRLWISRVGSNISGDDGGYALFDLCHRTQLAGRTYILKLKGAGISSTAGAQAYWRVWWDFNHDFDFDDPGELVWQGYGSFDQFAVYTIPLSACSGCTRMRVTLSDNFQDACGSYAVGETEDYDVRIRSANNCPVILMPHAQQNNHLKLSQPNETDEDFAQEFVPLSVEMFPNPAQDYVNIRIAMMEESQRVSVRLLDISGKELFRNETNNPGSVLDLQVQTAMLANGVYQVSVQNDNGFRQVLKLMITR